MHSAVGAASKRDLDALARRMSRTRRLQAFEALCREAAELAAAGRKARASRRR